LFIKFAARSLACFALAGVFTALSAAQQTRPGTNPDSSTQAQPQTPTQGAPTPAPQPAASPDSDKPKKDQTSSGEGKVQGTSNDRLFYTLPNFLSLEKGGKLPPLSAKDKFKVVALGSFDYVEFPWWGVLAAIAQAQNSQPAFKQGWLGYAKRYGTTAGDSLVENFMVGAVFPATFRQDPRFYYSGQGGFFRRTGYAVSRIFVTRGDSGHRQFNFSEVLGAATAASISTYSYHPKSTFVSTPSNPHLFISSERSLENAVDVYGTQLSLDTITLVIKEFWPDIHRKMSHKHKEAIRTGATTP
jgi:hypothetical protein